MEGKTCKPFRKGEFPHPQPYSLFSPFLLFPQNMLCHITKPPRVGSNRKIYTKPPEILSVDQEILTNPLYMYIYILVGTGSSKAVFSLSGFGLGSSSCFRLHLQGAKTCGSSSPACLYNIQSSIQFNS